MSHLGIRTEGLGIRADLFFEEIKSKLSYDFKDWMPGKTSNLKNHLGNNKVRKTDTLAKN